MTAPSLSYETSGARCAVVALRGEWDSASVDQLVAAVSRAMDEGRTCIVVDLIEVTFVDSTFLRELLNLDKMAVGEYGLALVLPDHGPVRRLFTLTALDQRFRILPSREEALAAM